MKNFQLIIPSLGTQNTTISGSDDRNCNSCYQVFFNNYHGWIIVPQFMLVGLRIMLRKFVFAL